MLKARHLRPKPHITTARTRVGTSVSPRLGSVSPPLGDCAYCTSVQATPTCTVYTPCTCPPALGSTEPLVRSTVTTRGKRCHMMPVFEYAPTRHSPPAHLPSSRPPRMPSRKAISRRLRPAHSATIAIGGQHRHYVRDRRQCVYNVPGLKKVDKCRHNYRLPLRD